MGRKNMPRSGRDARLALLTPTIAARCRRPNERVRGRQGLCRAAPAVLANCSRAQITVSLLPYMYRSWHLSCSRGEPPLARGTSTVGGISKG